METAIQNKLLNQSVNKVFFQYLIPSLIGMMLMSINILIDGIFVGNAVGSTALASVNIAVPVFSILISVSLWIGIGGGTLYSIALGENNVKRARSIFTFSLTLVTLLVVVFCLIGYLNVNQLADLLGANTDTKPYVIDYLSILLLFGVFMAIENALSIFIRNDGNPQLAMISLVLTAISNILLNYWMIFILELGVKGAALATVLSGVIGLLVLLLHFTKKDISLKLIKFKWSFQSMSEIFSIGFPSFLAEMGTLVFVISYNLMMVELIGTNGVAAFSVVNYLHAFMFLAFFGIGSAIQPMISFYKGAHQKERIQATIRIAEKTSILLGVLFLIIGFTGARQLVSLFGITSPDIETLAIQGIQLFFIGYLFMGINFIYMTYYQSIGQVGPAIYMIMLRSFVLMLVAIWLLPKWIGVNGVWLALPLSEFLVALGIIVFLRKLILKDRNSYKENKEPSLL
ncbi:MATE family efflux transporter [Cytobacillus spongiae]|uniref:MATE family efflux transporter n=1 Tax=Cytobacillus spongiae TaxID=2901381 RepID=UPI001F3A975B|nr:MATE family efflux transporter [Cytobacillus spongiae]UII55382.1 MATE family efflux transporter [Cytobacillus spongiae]